MYRVEPSTAEAKLWIESGLYPPTSTINTTSAIDKREAHQNNHSDYNKQNDISGIYIDSLHVSAIPADTGRGRWVRWQVLNLITGALIESWPGLIPYLPRT